MGLTYGVGRAQALRQIKIFDWGECMGMFELAGRVLIGMAMLAGVSAFGAAVLEPDAPVKLVPERHVFVIRNFKTESGVVLPEARVVYGVYGHLNADRSNAMLLPSHYMAKLTGYEWLMGPGKGVAAGRAGSSVPDYV